MSTGWTGGGTREYSSILAGCGDAVIDLRWRGRLATPTPPARPGRAHGKFRLPSETGAHPSSKSTTTAEMKTSLPSIFIVWQTWHWGGNMETLSVLSPSRPAKPGPSAGFRSGAESPTMDGWSLAVTREGGVARLPDLQLDLASELDGCGLLEARRQLPVPIRVLSEGKSLKAHGWAC